MNRKMKKRINKPIIKHQIGDIELIRRGRGFSRSELKDSGLNNIKIARKNGIPVDMLRKTKNPENIEQLKPIAREILDSKNISGKRE